MTTNMSSLPVDYTHDNNSTQLSTTQPISYAILSTMSLVGFLGNLLILVAMGNRKFSHMSTSVYLAVLAVSDILTVFSGVFTIVVLGSDQWLDLHLRSEHIALCVTLEFLVYWGPKVSCWCIVAITLERFVAVLMPHR